MVIAAQPLPQLLLPRTPPPWLPPTAPPPSLQTLTATMPTDDPQQLVHSCSGLAWALPPCDDSAVALVWVGPPESDTLLHLQLQQGQAVQWVTVDPETGCTSHGVAMATSVLQRRRRYLMQRAREASVVGARGWANKSFFWTVDNWIVAVETYDIWCNFSVLVLSVVR